MQGYEGSHAFAAPHRPGSGVLFVNESGEGIDVTVPIMGVPNVPLARGDGIVALSSQVGGINRNSGKMLLQVFTESAQIGGRSGDAMKTDHHRSGGAAIFWKPLVIGEAVPIEGREGGVVESGLGDGRGHGGVGSTARKESEGQRDLRKDQEESNSHQGSSLPGSKKRLCRELPVCDAKLSNVFAGPRTRTYQADCQ